MLHEAGRLMLNSLLMEWFAWSWHVHVELNFALPSHHGALSTSSISTSLSITTFFINRIVKSRERLLIPPACEEASLSSSSVSKVEEAKAAPPAQLRKRERELSDICLLHTAAVSSDLCWSGIRQSIASRVSQAFLLHLAYWNIFTIITDAFLWRNISEKSADCHIYPLGMWSQFPMQQHIFAKFRRVIRFAWAANRQLHF